jgi:signal peptidase
MKLIGRVLKWLGIGVYVACALIIVTFLTSFGGWKALNVLTGSMKPAINPGDLVIIHPTFLRNIHSGDVITYKRNDQETTITHRVTSVKGEMVTVKGDANESEDTPFAVSRIIGKAALVVPGAGLLTKWLQSPIGLSLLVILPGMLVMWAESKNLFIALAMPKEGVTKEVDEILSDPKAIRPINRVRRSIDGMSRVTAIIVLVTLAGIGGTYALPHTNAAKLAGNSFSVTTNTPTSADQCKNGGWATFKNPDGSAMFKNQGQCVAYVNSANPGKHITSSTTTVTVTNSSSQLTASGSVSGGGTSGDRSNSNTASTGVNVTN